MNPLLSAVIWLALTPAAFLASLLPRRFELWFGPKLGRFLLLVDFKRRRIAYDNIRRCLPELGERGWRKLLRENYEHYGILALEMLHEFSPVPGHFRKYSESLVVLDGLEHWTRAHEKGKGVLLVTGHFANWEVAGLIGARGVPIMMAVRTLKPAWLDRRIVAARTSFGATLASGKRILPAMIKHLKSGGTVGFVMDQYAGPPIGVPAAFFGVKVDTQAAVGLLVQRTGAAIVFGFQRRDEQGRIHVIFAPGVDLTPEQLADPVASTEALVAHVEAFIRANPAQWLWVHRRFKRVVWPAESAAAQ